MDDSQREAMYNGWKNSKIFLKPKKDVDSEKAVVSVEFEGKTYTEEFYKKDCFGSSEPYNIAFNRLVYKMKDINPNIELEYQWK